MRLFEGQYPKPIPILVLNGVRNIREFDAMLVLDVEPVNYAIIIYVQFVDPSGTGDNKQIEFDDCLPQWHVPQGAVSLEYLFSEGPPDVLRKIAMAIEKFLTPASELKILVEDGNIVLVLNAGKFKTETAVDPSKLSDWLEVC
jgi:hypothetical protein